MNPKYRFYFNTDGSGDFNDDFNDDFLRSGKRYVNPLWPDSLAVVFTKESGEQFFRRTLSGALTFVANDYDYITSKAFDTKFSLTIEKSDDNGNTWADYWSGKFYKTDCRFDADAKTVQVTPAPEDTYGAVLDGLDKEYNLIELAPEIAKLNYYKRPLIQVYLPGESVISCFISGMWWEQDCTPEFDTTKLVNDYHFGLFRTESLYQLTGEVDLYLQDIDGTEGYRFEQYQVSDPFGDYWVSELIETNSLRRWYKEEVPLNPRPTFPIELQPDTHTGATSLVTISNEPLKFYGRMLLDVEKYFGNDTFALSSDDIVPNNRNYSRVYQYTNSSSFVLSKLTSNTPTQWGLYENGKYYQRPEANIYPILRTLWKNYTFWYKYTQTDADREPSLRKQMVLKDAYPLYSVISVLLGKIAPGFTHGDGVSYSAFLYGSMLDVTFKATNFKPFISPKSNVLNSNYDMPAQKAPITLRAVLDMLQKCFRCYWWIEDNKLRIEHIEYFRNGGSYSGSPTVGIDLTAMETTRNGKSWAFCSSQYSYDKAEMPQRYEFSWMDDVSNIFEGYPIEMVSGFVDKSRVEKINVGQFTSDIDYMLANPQGCSQDGFALICAKQTLNNWFVPFLTDGIYSYQNGYAAFVSLETYYYYDMPGPNFTVNGVSHTASGTKRLKVQDVSFPSMADPDTIKLVRTNIGDGEISKLSVTLSSRNVKATLNYDTE